MHSPSYFPASLASIKPTPDVIPIDASVHVVSRKKTEATEARITMAPTNVVTQLITIASFITTRQKKKELLKIDFN